MKNTNTHYFVLLIGFAFLFSYCDNQEVDGEDEVVVEEVNQTIVLLDSMIQLEPRNADLYYDRALYYYQEGNEPKAIADVYSALHIDSANISYYMLAGELFIETGQGDKAVAIMSKANNMIPGNEDLHLKSIVYNYYLKDYETALMFTNDLIALNKYNPDAYFFKGLIYQEMGQKNKAISAFQTCVEVDPTYYNAHMQLGLIFSKQEDELALQYFENAIALDPSSREAYYAKAYFYQDKKDFNAAIKHYREMVALNPKDHEVFFNIGHCYIGLDSLEKAYKNFDIATQIQPQYAGAYFMKGTVREMQGANEEALQHYEQALIMLPEDEKIADAVERLK